MFNLFDILQSQGGGGMQAVGQQFGLNPDQSRRAMEALLPALTLGLQRNAASDPAGLGRLFGLADPRQGAQPDMLLGQLFGSPALSQAVLQQAAAASGIGTQALRQMLPVMAGMVVAGIVHVMLNQSAPAQPARREPEPAPPAAFPAVGFWNEWMDSLLFSANTGTPENVGPTPPPAPAPAPAPKPAPAPQREAISAPHGTAAGPPKSDETEEVPLEMFQQMFQTGVQVQEQNARAMQDIFDSFWSRSPEDAVEAGGTTENVALKGDDGSAPVGVAAKKPRKAGSKSRSKIG